MQVSNGCKLWKHQRPAHTRLQQPCQGPAPVLCRALTSRLSRLRGRPSSPLPSSGSSSGARVMSGPMYHRFCCPKPPQKISTMTALYRTLSLQQWGGGARGASHVAAKPRWRRRKRRCGDCKVVLDFGAALTTLIATSNCSSRRVEAAGGAEEGRREGLRRRGFQAARRLLPWIAGSYQSTMSEPRSPAVPERNPRRPSPNAGAGRS